MDPEIREGFWSQETIKRIDTGDGVATTTTKKTVTTTYKANGRIESVTATSQVINGVPVDNSAYDGVPVHQVCSESYSNVKKMSLFGGSHMTVEEIKTFLNGTDTNIDQTFIDGLLLRLKDKGYNDPRRRRRLTSSERASQKRLHDLL